MRLTIRLDIGNHLSCFYVRRDCTYTKATDTETPWRELISLTDLPILKPYMTWPEYYNNAVNGNLL